VVAHALRRTPLDWTEGTGPDVPVAVSAETRRPGDDWCVELEGSRRIEVQCKHGLQRGPDLTACWAPTVLIRSGKVRRLFLRIGAPRRGVRFHAGERHRPAVGGKGAGGEPYRHGGPRRGARGDLLIFANDGPTTSVDDLQRVMMLVDGGELRREVFRQHQKQEVPGQVAPVAEDGHGPTGRNSMPAGEVNSRP